MKQIDYLRKSRKNCSALLMACALTFMLLTTTLSFAQTNSLTLGCPTTASGGGYSYSNLDLNAGDGAVRSISISFSDDPEDCSINLPADTPPGWSIAASSNFVSKYITLPEGVSATDIENYLRLVSFSVPNNTIRSVSIIMQTNISGNVIYYSDNGHYYQYVPFTNNERTWTWIDCYDAAKEMTYCGRQGYLATLTSLDEDKFVTRLVSTPMWVGGTRLSPTDNATSSSTQYYASFDTDDEPNDDDTDYWYWACGPEKGMQITPGVANPYQDESQYNNAVTWWNTIDAYSNWMYIHRRYLGDEHEPNNNQGNGGESCLVILSLSDRSSEENHTPGFGWADIGYDVNAIGKPDRYNFDPEGYLVEYGDQVIGDSQPQENECSISASGLVGNATRTVKATLSGSTAVCAGEEATLNIIFEGGAFPFTGSVQGNNGEVVHFNTNDISYNFTVAPTETTSYTISTFSDASSTTGSNGCPGVYNIIYETTGSATVTVNTPQVALTDITPVAICAGASTTLTATTTETVTGNVTYAWSTGATGSEITVTPSATTTYTVTATATQGECTATATKSVTVTVNTPQVALTDIAPVAICAGASTNLTAELDGTPTGNVTYAWSTGATGSEITVTPSETTTYTVTATANYNGCMATATKSVTVTVNALPTATVSVTDVLCNGASNGSVALTVSGGTTPYSYVWSNEATTEDLSSVSAGTYIVTVADANGCTTTASATVSQPSALTLTSVTATDETCKENNDGTIAYTVGGGTLDYTITFAEGISVTQNAAGTYTQSDLSAGDYVVKVVDQNGCSVTAPAVTINEPETLEIHQEGNIIPAQCKGDNNGQFAFSIAGGNGTNTITITINGEAIVLATPSEGVYTQTGLAAGTYTVSVTDNKDCSATKDFVVGEPGAVLSATVTSTQESCTGHDGTATVAAAGGNGGYSFEWSNGQNSATATNLSSFSNGGLYTVTVTDAEGCTNVQNVTITLNNPLAMAPITGPAVCTGTEFSITPQNGINGTIPAGTTYSWPAPDAISGIGGLAAGIDRSSINGVLTNSNSTPQTVSYTVTPKVGVCVGNAVDVTVTVTTTVNPNVTIDMPNTMTVCSNAEIFNLSATFVNSVSNSTVVWKKDGTPMATHTVTGDTDSYAIDLANDTCKGQYTYRVEYTDVSGCTASDACVITVNAGDWSISQPAGDTTVECVSAAIQPAESLLPVVEDGCGRTTTCTLLRRESNPTEITCTGTVTYTYRYTACDDTYKDWTYTYTIEHEDFTMPADTGSTVACPSATDTPPTLPVVKDACGNVLEPIGDPVVSTKPVCEGKRTYTYTYRDCAGHSHDWTYTYTIDMPSFEAIASQSATVDCPAAAVAPHTKEGYTMPVVTDACGNNVGYELTTSPSVVSCEGTMDYVYTYEDCAGNRQTFTYTYTIDMPTFAAIAPQTETVDCLDDAVAPHTRTDYTMPVVKDACGNVLAPTETSPVISDTPECEGDVTYTYTYEDCAGNRQTFTYTYTIDMPTFAAIAPQTETVDCPEDAVAPHTRTDYTMPVVTDACENNVDYVLTTTLDSVSCEGTKAYVYTYTDCAGNSQTFTYTYTIDMPTFAAIAPQTETVDCPEDAVAPHTRTDFTMPVVTDVCGNNVDYELTTTPNAVSCEGPMAYVYTYTDCANNSQTFTYTYTIDRTTAPNEVGGPVATASTVGCIADATAPTTLPVVKDVCGNTLTDPTLVEGGTYTDCEGTKTYTYTYEDCSGLQYVWTYTYTITAPTLTFTGSINDVDDVDACYSDTHKSRLLTADQVKAMYTSSCSREISVEISDTVVRSSDCDWMITRTYNISDGGCNTDSQTMSVSGSDQSAPALTGTWPENITGQNNCFANADISGLLSDDDVKAMYSDCSTITVTHSDANTLTADCGWTITRAYIIKDACGNTVTPAPAMSVSGSDQTAPAIGTDDLDSTLTATNCVFRIPDLTTEVRNISNDLCTPNADLIISQSPAAGTVLAQTDAAQNVTVTVTVKDLCGNESTKEVVVVVPTMMTVTATATPATICYGATSQLTATPSNVVGTATYNWTPSDGLNNATIANPVATLTTTTTYTVEVTDENGCAATATTTVTVNPEVVMDTVAPMTLCVGDVTSYSFTTPLTVGTMSYAWTNSNTAIGLGANGEGDIPSFTPTNTTNAPINATITVTPSHTYNDITCVGDPINFTITVRPSIKTPGNVEFACPADTTVVLSYSDCEQVVNIGEPEFVNNMSGMNVNITNDAPEGNIFPEGTTIVTWTATDECGDTLTCTQNVQILFPPCGDSIADFDGYRYSSVRIGCQCWTGENARSEHYSDGTPVDNFRYYNDSDSLENIYGKLYTWYSAVRVPEGDNNAEPSTSTDPFGNTYVQGICPEGWALPTVDEYMLMIANSGDATHAKDGSNLYWLPGYEGQPPFSGFDAYGAGKYNGAIDRYQELLGKTHFWTTLSGSGSETATTVEINYYCAEGLQTELSKGDGVSIRCIRKR